MKRDQYFATDLVIGERVVGASRITFLVDEGVVAHVFVAKASSFENGSDSTLKFHVLPAVV